MKLILLLSLFATAPLFAQAQEQTGHGRHHQQQQQQQKILYKGVVITGSEAEALFQLYSKQSATEDLSLKCSAPVMAVYHPEKHHRSSVCFDRGETFGANRYKCYVFKEARHRTVREALFNWFHNSCGGDGIYPFE